MLKLPLFGRFGFGFDVTDGNAMDPVVEFHYDDGKDFPFRGETYRVPREIIVDPSPSSTELEDTLVSIHREIRDVQVGLAQQVGLKGPIKAGAIGEFARDVQVTVANQRFQSGLAILARVSGSYSYFTMRTSGALTPTQAFLDLMAQCRDGGGTYYDLFAAFGTHFVSRASVGGRMDMLTSINADTIENKWATDGQLGMQAGVEYRGITADSATSFEYRSEQLQATYRDNSSRSLVLMGGDITVDTLGDWKHSLDGSELPPEQYAQPHRSTRRAKLWPGQGGRLLNLDPSETRPISDLCDSEVRPAVEQAIRQYVDQFGLATGRKRKVPLVAGSQDAGRYTLAPGDSCSFGGWLFADNDIEIGLEAEPGAQGKVVISHPLHSNIKRDLLAGQVDSWSEYFGAGQITMQFESDSTTARLHVREW